MHDDDFDPTLAGARERFAERVRDRATWLLLRSGATVGAIGALFAGTPGCTLETSEPEASVDESLLSSSVLDWAQQRGTRERGMVRYEGRTWRELSDCGPRGGCATVTMFVQLFVRQVPGVNVDDKRVGLAVRRQWASAPENVLGYYVRTDWEGWEEWHVPVRMRAWDGQAFSFDAWYEDGVWTENGKRVWYDDNAGDLYPVVPIHVAAIQQLWDSTQLVVDEHGVRGRIDARIANFDFDKDVAIVATTDGWQTTHTFGIGQPGEANRWYYVDTLTGPSDAPADYERWRIDIDLPGAADHFEYALVYRHGLGDGARRYEFWDNNGFRNHRVERVVVE